MDFFDAIRAAAMLEAEAVWAENNDEDGKDKLVRAYRAAYSVAREGFSPFSAHLIAYRAASGEARCSWENPLAYLN